MEIDGEIGLTLLNWPHAEPSDGRSALANLGFEAAQGRYLAFLDYDDTSYPEAHRLLIGRLRAGPAAVAFGGICWKIMDRDSGFPYAVAKQCPFKGSRLRDLFVGNFCPIHSFVIDRTRIPRQFMFFDPLLTRAEDYDFLLRICSQYESDFSLVGTIIGDYCIKTDGTNTINTEWRPSPDGSAAWVEAEAFLEQRRRMTPVSTSVQRLLGLPPRSNLTIRDLLDAPECA